MQKFLSDLIIRGIVRNNQLENHSSQKVGRSLPVMQVTCFPDELNQEEISLFNLRIGGT